MVQVRLLSMTVILTALIWISADRIVNESAILKVAVVLTPAQPQTGMILQTQGLRNSLDVTVSGARRVVEAVRGREGLQVKVPVLEQLTGPGVVAISEEIVQRELAQRWSEFETLRILGVQPQEIPVLVDHMVARDVEISAKKLTLAYEVEPQLQPPSVRLRLRESRTSDLPSGQPISLEISPEIERALKEKPFGKSQTLSIALDPKDFGPDAVFTPRSIEVTATVRAERAVQQIPTVPILVAVIVGNLSRSVEAVARDGSPLSLITQTISVTGTPEAIARLASGQTRVYGIIHLKEEDLENLDVVKLVTPEFHLPRDVELTGNPQPIELKLVESTSRDD